MLIHQDGAAEVGESPPFRPEITSPRIPAGYAACAAVGRSPAPTLGITKRFPYLNSSEITMKSWAKIRIAIAFAVIPILPAFPSYLLAQGLTMEQIRENLLSNPPHTGNVLIRELTILALDNILKNDSSRTAPSVKAFYDSMMAKVETELRDPVSAGAAIWMMYNHGFVIKTLNNVFAFDLVDGYSGWSGKLPAELLAQIEVLFISHRHGDHNDESVLTAVMNNGGFVVYPSESSIFGNTPMAAGDSINLLGLEIKAHNAIHGVPLRTYEVTTSSGLKFLHTGNQTSVNLPDVKNLDLLLINAWMNESGSTSAVIGMRNAINKLKPEVMIPGHIQELGHAYIPGNPTSRVPYEWAYEVDDVVIPSQVQVMAWG